MSELPREPVGDGEWEYQKDENSPKVIMFRRDGEDYLYRKQGSIYIQNTDWAFQKIMRECEQYDFQIGLGHRVYYKRTDIDAALAQSRIPHPRKRKAK